MRLADEFKLIILLMDLMHCQENVTICKGKGEEFKENTNIFIRQRTEIYNKILNYVRFIVDNRVQTGL